MAKEQFVKIDYELMHSVYYQTQTTIYERDLLAQIKGARNRKNREGEIINRRDSHIEFGFSDSFGMSKSSFVRAIVGLRIKGFIKLVRPGKFPRQKAVYAIINKWKIYNRNMIREIEGDNENSEDGTTEDADRDDKD